LLLFVLLHFAELKSIKQNSLVVNVAQVFSSLIVLSSGVIAKKIRTQKLIKSNEKQIAKYIAAKSIFFTGRFS